MSSFSRFFSFPRKRGSAPELAPFEWREASGTAKGCAVLIHGLNNHVELMLPLSEIFQSAGYHTLLPRLSGHRNGGWQRVDYAREWRTNLENAVGAAKQKYPDLPLVVAGYSLGATLALAHAGSPSLKEVRTFILFAPAICVSPAKRFISLLTPFRFANLAIPSLTPEKWRMNPSTSLYAYRGMFGLIDRILPAELAKIRCVFFLDPKDELVIYPATLEWLRSNQLSNVEVIETQGTSERFVRHLLVDPEARGAEEWEKLRNGVLSKI